MENPEATALLRRVGVLGRLFVFEGGPDGGRRGGGGGEFGILLFLDRGVFPATIILL